MKKRYCLLIVKEARYKQIAPDVARFRKIIPFDVAVVLYRKNKKFYIDHRFSNRTMFTWWQAWYWYWLIHLLGRKHGEKLFAYKKTSGRVIVKKMY